MRIVPGHCNKHFNPEAKEKKSHFSLEKKRISCEIQHHVSEPKLARGDDAVPHRTETDQAGVDHQYLQE